MKKKNFTVLRKPFSFNFGGIQKFSLQKILTVDRAGFDITIYSTFRSHNSKHTINNIPPCSENFGFDRICLANLSPFLYCFCS